MALLRPYGFSGAMLALLVMAWGSPSSVQADLVLSDNLEATTGDTATASGDTWLAASFSTDATGYDLASVTLLLDRSSIGGQAVLGLYTDGGLVPDSLVGTLSSPGSISSSLEPTTFSASGISLAADTTYWVVLSAPTGSFDWAWTADNTGNGVGFQVAWSQSDDAGGTWFTADNYPFQMSVSASAVPEPSPIMLAGAGAAVLLLRLCRRSGRHCAGLPSGAAEAVA